MAIQMMTALIGLHPLKELPVLTNGTTQNVEE